MRTWGHTDDDVIECPACDQTFSVSDSGEMAEDSKMECQKCGTALVCIEVEYSRTWSWATADSKRWHDFCWFWTNLGYHIVCNGDRYVKTAAASP